MSWDPSTVQALQSLPYPLARHKSVGVEQGSVLSTKPQDELAGTGRLDCFQSLKKANSPAQSRMPDMLSICGLENAKTTHPRPENQAVSLRTSLTTHVTQRQSGTIKQFPLFS